MVRRSHRSQIDTHVSRLIEEVKPGMTDRAHGRAIARLEGEREDEKPFRAFDEAVPQGKVPPRDQIRRLARYLGVEVVDVVEACLLDVGLPTTSGYDPEQHRAARLVGQMPAGRRGRFVDGVEAMLDAFGITRESTRESEELF